MRILVVSQYFPPETGAAPARTFHFARAMTRRGHGVRVVTGLPNHPSGTLAEGYRGGARRRETLEGIAVERVWLFTSARKDAWRRLWNQLTFALAALPAALRGPRPDLVFATTPPLFLGVSAWLAACRWRAPLVLDVRDDWPRAAVALGELRPGPAVAALDFLARFLRARAARVTVVTGAMRTALAARGLDEGRIAVAPHGADAERFVPGPARDGARPLRVLYAGTHGLAHGMEVILEAAARLRDPATWRFAFVGDGVAKAALERRARAEGLTHVEFAASQPPAELVATIHAADLCVVTTTAHEFLAEIVSVKVFDYLACARPVVGAVSGETARVVRESGGGVVVAPGDAAGLVAALEGLAADPEARARMGRAGRAFVEAEASRAAIGERLVTLLEEVATRHRGRPVAPRPAGPYRPLKRLVDLVVAAALLVALAPVLLVTALAIRLDSPGPALFRQRRVGRGSSEFTILKFRTMHAGTPDLASHLMGPGSARVTRLGRWLRRTSIDELPQLWNILRGSMSLVGPRPALHNQHDLIAMREAAGVDALKPGVTGWAQIHGRDDIPLPLKVSYDAHYLARCSPWLDLWIVLRTVGTLFSSRGVY